jgi:hypothetical protein
LSAAGDALGLPMEGFQSVGSARSIATSADTIPLSIAILILADQIRSKLQHIRAIRALCFNGSNLEVLTPNTEKWVSAYNMNSFCKQIYAYPAPWRPFTVGYVGIEIRLKGVRTPAEDLFAYGLVQQRDLVFDYLKGLWPEKAIEKE